MQKGYTQIYTGNGKGKTTAALGLITRAVGSNFKIFFCQFLKGRDYGELHTLKKFETVTHERYGRGVFIRSKEYVTDEDKKLMREGYESLKNALLSGKYDIVIADEILGTLRYDLISVDEIKFLIENIVYAYSIGYYKVPEKADAYLNTFISCNNIDYYYKSILEDLEQKKVIF